MIGMRSLYQMMNKMRGDVTVDHDYLLCQHLGLGLAPLCNLGFIPLPRFISQGPQRRGWLNGDTGSLTQSLTVLPPWVSAPNLPGRASDSLFPIKSPQGLVCPGLSW